MAENRMNTRRRSTGEPTVSKRLSVQAIDAPELSPEELTRAKEVFQGYDYDGSGTIDMTELREMLTEFQWCMDSKGLDTFVSNFLGTETMIDFQRFLHLYRVMLGKQPPGVRKKKGGGVVNVRDLRGSEADARKIFEEIDVCQNGYLNMDEMRIVMRQSGLPDTDGDNYEAVVLEHMRMADQDNDGHISFDEFIVYRNAVIEHFYKNGIQMGGEPSLIDGFAEDDSWAPHQFVE